MLRLTAALAKAGDVIWDFHRSLNTVPPGSATCINRGEANPPILEFDPSGRLLKSVGAGLFAYPHGFTIDHDENLWPSDVNDSETVLGIARELQKFIVHCCRFFDL